MDANETNEKIGNLPSHLEGLRRLDEKVVIVTGANSGIGKQLAANLARLGAHVVMACRSISRGQAARESLLSSFRHSSLEVMELDQSNLESIETFARDFASRHRRLDVLANNAGMYPGSRELSTEGIEMTWATNVLGYVRLTKALTPSLEASETSRVLFVASKLAGGLQLDDLEFERRRFGGIAAYKQSKQANRMLARQFVEQFAGREIKVATIHPGGINTGIGRHQKGLWGWLVRLAFRTQKPVTAGADTATWLATRPHGELETGLFWADRAERECEFRDADAEQQLWKRCEDYDQPYG